MPDAGPTWDSLPISTRTTEQLLRALVDLVIATRSATELTAENVSRAFDLDLQQFDNGDVGSYALLTPTRSYALRIHTDPSGSPRVRFSFFFKDNSATAEPPSAELRFDDFAAQLSEGGFERHTRYGEHGRRLGEDFVRGDLHLQVTLTAHAVADGPVPLTIRSVIVG